MTFLVIGTGLAVLGSLTILLGLRHPGLQMPLILGALLRVVVGLVGLHAVPITLPYTSSDANVFERRAWEMASTGWGSVIDGLNPANGFDVVSPFALIYAVVGRQPHALVFYNVLLGIGTVALSYGIARSLGGIRLAGRTAWAVALFPATILMSSVILRESGVAFGVALGFFGVLEALRRRSVRFVLLGVAGFAFAAFLHGGILLAAVAVLFTLALMQSRNTLKGGRIHLPTALAAGVALVLFVAVTSVLASGELRLASLGVVNFESLEAGILAENPRDAAGGSAYYGGTTTQSWGQAIAQLPGRVALFMFSPLPWTATSATQVLGVVDGLLWGLMVLTLAVYGRRIWGDPRARLMLLFVVLGVVTYALGTTNAGTALRHRTKLIPVLLPLVLMVLARVTSPERTRSRPPNNSFSCSEGIALEERAQRTP